MQKGLLVGAVALLLSIGAVAQKSAGGSSYGSAIGLGIDFGEGVTLVGISGKHFFTGNHVGKAEILFGSGITTIQAFYLYHKEIEGADGLRWFAGAGPGVSLYRNSSEFLIRPAAGLDYKIKDVPLALSFDWRPTIAIGSGDTDFLPARFGLGFRFAFN